MKQKGHLAISSLRPDTNASLLFGGTFAQDNVACDAMLRHLNSVVHVEFYQIFNRRVYLKIYNATYNTTACTPLLLNGLALSYVQQTRYLGIVLRSARLFKCLLDSAKVKFYRCFNKSKSKSKDQGRSDGGISVYIPSQNQSK